MFVCLIYLYVYLVILKIIVNAAKCIYVETHSTLLQGVSALTYTSCNLLHTNMVIMVQFLSEFSPSLLLLMYEY